LNSRESGGAALAVVKIEEGAEIHISNSISIIEA
jgi:hypothetical protein